MSVVCIIPARGGSKRIPRKNIKSFCSRPLISYSIEVALKSGVFDRVIVSTEDEEIAKIAKEWGAEVPFMRPHKLADDHSSSGDAIEYTQKRLLESGYKVEYLCVIYPTAPLLQERYIAEGYEKLKSSDVYQVLSATSMPYPFQRSFKITSEGRCEMFFPEHFYTRSQDLEEAYHDAGQFYWYNLSITPSTEGFSSDAMPLILPRYLVQDIDTLEDFKRAEMMYKLLEMERESV